MSSFRHRVVQPSIAAPHRVACHYTTCNSKDQLFVAKTGARFSYKRIIICILAIEYSFLIIMSIFAYSTIVRAHHTLTNTSDMSLVSTSTFFGLTRRHGLDATVYTSDMNVVSLLSRLASQMAARQTETKTKPSVIF